MSDNDEDSVARPDWSTFDVPKDVSIAFFSHCNPTEAYHDNITNLEIQPFEDPNELFRESLGMSTFLVKVEPTTAHVDNIDLIGAWTYLFSNVLLRKTKCNFLEEDEVASLRDFALKVIQTPPSIFGDRFRLNSEAKHAEFVFDPIQAGEGDDAIEAAEACQRHDIAIWYSCFYILGKAFHIDGWETITSKALIGAPDLTQPVMQVDVGPEVFQVTLQAKQSMCNAIDATANRPTVFFKCKFTIASVAEILGVDWLEYSMPQTREELLNFDWNGVEPGRKETYPPLIQPADKEFERIRTVYQAVKEEKDAAARAIGQPKSGVQSYITFKQRWRQWRSIMAVYRWTEPTMDLATVEAKAMGRLKLCKSEDKMEEEIANDVKAHIAKLKRERAKQHDSEDIQKKLDAVQAEQEAAAEQERQAAVERERVEEEKRAIRDQQFEGSRQQAKESREAAMAAKEKEIQLAKKTQVDAAKAAQDKLKQQEALSKQKEKNKERDAIDLNPAPKKKRSKKNDVSLLDGESTPRARAAARGDEWMPPSKTNTGHLIVYDPPGDKWKKEKTTDLLLLSALRNTLKAEGLLGQPMTFSTLMEFIDADDEDLDLEFEDKVFIYLVALILHQKR